HLDEHALRDVALRARRTGDANECARELERRVERQVWHVPPSERPGARTGPSVVLLPARPQPSSAPSIERTASNSMPTSVPPSSTRVPCRRANQGASTSATTLISLIRMFIAGPAVSLNGSPTVSPTTAALCGSEPLPPCAPPSMYFFALSHAPPAFAMKSAMSTPVTVAPASMPPSALMLK